MQKKKYVKRIRILLKVENLFKNIYRYAGMDKIMTLSPLMRVKFWSGFIKILFIGYIGSFFSDSEILILLLIVMNIFVGWWCYKWKVYLTSINK